MWHFCFPLIPLLLHHPGDAVDISFVRMAPRRRHNNIVDNDMAEERRFRPPPFSSSSPSLSSTTPVTSSARSKPTSLSPPSPPPTPRFLPNTSRSPNFHRFGNNPPSRNISHPPDPSASKIQNSSPCRLPPDFWCDDASMALACTGGTLAYCEAYKRRRRGQKLDLKLVGKIAKNIMMGHWFFWPGIKN